MDRGAWQARVRGVTESDATSQRKQQVLMWPGSWQRGEFGRGDTGRHHVKTEAKTKLTLHKPKYQLRTAPARRGGRAGPPARPEGRWEAGAGPPSSPEGRPGPVHLPGQRGGGSRSTVQPGGEAGAGPPSSQEGRLGWSTRQAWRRGHCVDDSTPDIWSREKIDPRPAMPCDGTGDEQQTWDREPVPPRPAPRAPPAPALSSWPCRDHQEFPNLWSRKVLHLQKSDETPINLACRLTCWRVFTSVSSLSCTCLHSLCCWQETRVGARCSLSDRAALRPSRASSARGSQGPGSSSLTSARLT